MKIKKTEKKILCRIFLNNLEKKRTARNIQKYLDIEKKEFNRIIDNLISKQLVRKIKSNYILTEKGRKNIKVVLTGGVYDIIHPGHIHTLKNSKQEGDLLIVSIARDNRVIKIKGRKPINNERRRTILVSSIRYVDFTLLGSKGDIFGIVKKIKPNIITIGYDQTHQISELRRRVKINNLSIKIKKLDSPIPHVKSSNLRTKYKKSN
uniref:Cytidyltransferase-related domain-containing protein (TagD) n=1 Tax=uncultured marine thaumarchaeote KM3_86_F11 TaxID=1456322 RepID=A0A075HSP7_9ARCH|nr:Cytidyltransferase-related domain-containing protein (tagD) [uncultured marine thaumarchaeote KM3_86_F11]